MTAKPQYDGRLYSQAEVDMMMVEARIDELDSMYSRIMSEITVGGNNWPGAIKFRIDERIKALTTTTNGKEE